MLFKKLSQKFTGIFKKLRSKGKLSSSDINKAMREIKLALLEADVNYAVAKKFISHVSELAIGSDVLESLTPGQQIIKIVNDELCKIMGGCVNNKRLGIQFTSSSSTLVMICGLQGSGKTTNSVKLAHFYARIGHRPLLVACDVYRPAAVEQLKVMCKKAGFPVYFESEKTPIEIAKNSLSYAKDYGHDLVIFDTAGRLHIDDQLMHELQEMKSEIRFDEILLVVDSMMGQDAVNMAERFNKLLEIDGVILTKLDGDSRGGAAISVLEVTKKPIKFIGTGETLGDFEIFKPDRMTSRILGMGDVLTLIEKAQENIDKQEINKLGDKLRANKFDMDDLLAHMKKIEKMGSIKKIVEMIPGVSNKISNSDLENGENKMLKIQAMISSMTKKERKNPSLLNFSRKQRIAKGSGTEISDINILLRQFDQMQKFFKQFSGKRRTFKKNVLSKFK